MIHRHIGLRTIKTGIAVTLAVFIAYLLKLKYPFFVGITTIISMDKTVVNTFKLGRNRIYGTILGAIIGTIMALIEPGNPLLCGLGVILLITICNKLGIQSGISVGGIVILAIMVHTKENIYLYAINRTLDTFIGASIAFIVNISIFPYYNFNRIQHKVKSVKQAMDSFIDYLEENNQAIDLPKLQKDLLEAKEFLHLYKNEILLSRKKETTIQLEQDLNRLQDILTQYHILQTIHKEKHPSVFAYHKEAIYQQYLQLKK